LWDGLQVLNVSFNPRLQLDSDDWPGIGLDVLDISGSGVSLVSEMCTPGVNLFASNTQSPDMQRVAHQCSMFAQLLDISAENVSAIQLALSEIVHDLEHAEGITNSTLPVPPTFRLQTTTSPVHCRLQQGFRMYSKNTGRFSTVDVYAPVLEYQ